MSPSNMVSDLSSHSAGEGWNFFLQDLWKFPGLRTENQASQMTFFLRLLHLCFDLFGLIRTWKGFFTIHRRLPQLVPLPRVIGTELFCLLDKKRIKKKKKRMGKESDGEGDFKDDQCLGLLFIYFFTFKFACILSSRMRKPVWASTGL